MKSIKTIIGEVIKESYDIYTKEPNDTQADDKVKASFRDMVKNMDPRGAREREDAAKQKQAVQQPIQETTDDMVEYDVPEWSLSALINGDDSGLENEDIVKLNKFKQSVVNQYGNAHFMLNDIDGEDNLGFRYNNDIDNLGSNVYRVYIKPSK